MCVSVLVNEELCVYVTLREDSSTHMHLCLYMCLWCGGVCTGVSVSICVAMWMWLCHFQV